MQSTHRSVLVKLSCRRPYLDTALDAITMLIGVNNRIPNRLLLKRRKGVIMRRMRSGALVVLAALAATACTGVLPTAIEKLKEEPRGYIGRTVTVRGEVTEATSLLVFKYFELRDATGAVYVTTTRPLPAVGEKLTVRGVVRELDLGPLGRIIALEEQEKKSGGR